jgi:16S rRNA G1207 methylase RsmC
MSQTNIESTAKKSTAEKSTTKISFRDQEYLLRRYPYEKRSQLKAWDAADNYLLSVVDEMAGEFSRLCIVHDNFGALTLPLLNYEPICYGDSWMSLEAVRLNIKANSNTQDKELNFETDLDKLVKSSDVPDLIIGRVPKSKSELSYMLSRLKEWVKPNCTLLLAGMDKHLSKGQYDLLETCFGPASFFPGVKKARIWKATVNKDLKQTFDLAAFEQKNQVKIPGCNFNLSSLPNVFSNDHLDIGSRFFLEHFSKLPNRSKVADLACGNGVLGLAYLFRVPEASVTFYDESFQAIKSAKKNLGLNLPDTQAEFVVSDGLSAAESNSLDLILCNPPFHQQNAVSTSIAHRFFREAKRALSSDGELWIVANRHLAYHAELKRIFGNYENIAGNKKFVVLKARK